MAKLVKYTGFFVEMNRLGTKSRHDVRVLPSKKRVSRKFKLVQRKGDSETQSRVIVFHKKSACFSIFVFGVVKPCSLSQNNEILILEKRLISFLIYYFP